MTITNLAQRMHDYEEPLYPSSAIDLYMHSFVNDVSDKRIKRYCKKLENICSEFLYENFPQQEEYHFSFPQLLLDICFSRIYYYNERNSEELFFRIIRDHYITNENIETFKNILEQSEVDPYEDPIYIEMAEYHFKECCKRYVAINSCIHDYNASNFMQCLPEQDIETLSIIEDTLNSLWCDICRKLSYKAMDEDKYEGDYEKRLGELRKNITETLSENEKLKKQLNEKEYQNRILKEEKEKIRSSVYEKSQEASIQMEQEKEFYRKRYEKLLDKINKEKEEDVPISIPDTSEETQNLEVNTDLNYLFVTDPEYRSSKKIELAFPNSIITKSDVSISQLKKVDAVIFLTKNIKHGDYYKVKDMCMDHNIPYMHCVPVNVDAIKAKMLEDLTEYVTKEG